MEKLCDSVGNGCEGTYDVGLHFNEVQNSSVPFFFKIPAADEDVDDVTLGKMFIEAYRGQVDYFVQGGVSVRQSSSSVRSYGSGQLDGEMADGSGKPDEWESLNAQIRILFD